MRLRAEAPDEGLSGVSPRFVINALSTAITRGNARSLTSMELLLALKDAIESDARIDAKQKKLWFDHLVTARKEFYNRWVKEDVHRALFASFQDEAQQLLEKYLDEIEAALDQRKVTDPMTGENRAPDERFLRSVEEKIKVSESGKQSFRQEIIRKAMIAFKGGQQFRLASHARVREAIEQYLFEERRDVLRLVTSTARPDDEARQKISVVQERLIKEYGYDGHSAQEALNYVTSQLGARVAERRQWPLLRGVPMSSYSPGSESRKLSGWYDLSRAGSRDWPPHSEKIREAVLDHLPRSCRAPTSSINGSRTVQGTGAHARALSLPAAVDRRVAGRRPGQGETRRCARAGATRLRARAERRRRQGSAAAPESMLEFKVDDVIDG